MSKDTLGMHTMLLAMVASTKPILELTDALIKSLEDFKSNGCTINPNDESDNINVNATIFMMALKSKEMGQMEFMQEMMGIGRELDASNPAPPPGEQTEENTSEDNDDGEESPKGDNPEIQVRVRQIPLGEHGEA